MESHWAESREARQGTHDECALLLTIQRITLKLPLGLRAICKRAFQESYLRLTRLSFILDSLFCSLPFLFFRFTT